MAARPSCRLGIPDSNIILMVSEQPACSPRNVYAAQLYMSPGGGNTSSTSPLNLLSSDAEVDYRGRDVSVDSVLRVLTGGPAERGRLLPAHSSPGLNLHTNVWHLFYIGALNGAYSLPIPQLPQLPHTRFLHSEF